MPGKHLLIILFVIINNYVFGQINVSDSLVIKKYTSPDYLKTDSDNFILIDLSQNAPNEFRNKVLLNSARKLSENLFIIEAQKLQVIFSQKRFFKEYILSNDQWKLSQAAEQIYFNKTAHKQEFLFTIAVNSLDFIQKLLTEYPELRNTISEHPSLKMISIFSTYENINKWFLHHPAVLFIDVNKTPPKEELNIGGFDFSANKINIVHARYPAINGSGQHVSIKENYYDTTDIDLKGRLEVSPLATSIVTSHANFMATIIAGGGNSYYNTKGVAWAARISSSSFENVLPDPASYYNQYNITVQNHSYGTGVENTYGLNAVAFDKSAVESPALLHVIGSGNSGNVVSTSGMYSGIAGYANLSGNFKMAKNPIVVGGVDSFGIIAPYSSRGPAYDGRIKPDIVAFQKNGTSESAALVSGTALLLQQYHKNKNGMVMPSALTKAVLINSADDVNNPGPDYNTGFGNLNADRAIGIINENKILSGEVTHNSVQSYSIDIPQNVSQFKITLSWNDIDASAFAPKALINDLDIILVSSVTNEVWRPWVLSSFPHIDSLKKLPLRKRDSLNNVEQITLQNPTAGNYQVQILGYNVPSASQKFYAAYTLDTMHHFLWQFPVKNDFLETGRENIIRWETNITGTGNIEYSLVPSNTWNLVSANYDLSGKYFKWTLPDTTAQSIFRMKIGSTYFYSDTFLIAALPAPKVGFICSDTILVFWNRIKGATSYQVYQLGKTYMDPFIKVSDTAVLLSKSTLSEKYFSVAAVYGNITGPKSYALDYTLQGTGCFIRTFFVDANGNTATLNLLLGTDYRVSSIVFQKYSAGSFISIDSFPPNGRTSFTYNYQPLLPGKSLFRAKIILQNGEIIYSGIASVFYVEAGKYILLPVPLKRGTDLEILSTIPDGSVIQLFDVMGRSVLVKEIHSAHEYLNTSFLQPGQYFYRITKRGIKVSGGRLLIL